MLHSRSHIYELQMWQKVKELTSSFTLIAVQFEVCAYDIRDPTVGIILTGVPPRGCAGVLEGDDGLNVRGRRLHFC